MRPLSAPAQGVLLAIYDHIAKTGQSPLLRHLTTPTRPSSATQWLVTTLRNSGYLSRTRGHGTIALTPDGNRMAAALKGMERIGRSDAVAPTPLRSPESGPESSMSPLLEELLDELEPELRPDESLRALVRRLKREAERGREANYQPGGRDHDE